MTLPAFVSKVGAMKDKGYKAIEMPFLFAMQHGLDDFQELLEKEGLRYIPLFFSDGPLSPALNNIKGHPLPGASVSEHYEVMVAQYKALKAHPIYKHVQYINAHSGADYFTQKEIIEFFTKVSAFEVKEGLFVGHETHRMRALYSPWVTRDVLPFLPKELNITADLSHWIVVSERGPTDEHIVNVVKQIAPRVKHIHARVGHEEGSQVNDPRAPEWKDLCNGYKELWNIILREQIKSGITTCTVLPEHGPFPYQPSLPFSQMPIADIWEVNNWMGEEVTKQFKEL